MKAFLRIGLIAVAAIAITFITVEKMEAQVAPKVSTLYSVAQIEEMYKEHRVSRPQDTYAPQEISAKFVVDFPNARDIEWEKSTALYRVEFEIGRKDYKAYYDMSGNLVMYKAEIAEKELPAIVKNAALGKYPNFKFDGIDKIVKGNETSYEVDLEKGKLDVKMMLKGDGTIINEYID